MASDNPRASTSYAFTTHSLQGDTREVSYVLVGGSMQDRELSYVQMSRHRGEAHIYAVAGEVGISLEAMAGVMSGSRQKEIAQEKREEGLQITLTQSREGRAEEQERTRQMDAGYGISW